MNGAGSGEAAGIWELHFLAQDGPGTVIPVSGPLTLGRGSECGVVLPGERASRLHAQLVVSPDGLWLADLGSRNGTWVNGARLSAPCSLQPGDRLEVGGAQFVVGYTYRAVPAQVQTPVPPVKSDDAPPPEVYPAGPTPVFAPPPVVYPVYPASPAFAPPPAPVYLPFAARSSFPWLWVGLAVLGLIILCCLMAVAAANYGDAGSLDVSTGFYW